MFTSDPPVIQALLALDGLIEHMPDDPESYSISVIVVEFGMRATTDAALVVPPEVVPPDQ